MVLNHGSIVKTLGGKGILRKKCIFLPQKWPKWPKMAKKIPWGWVSPQNGHFWGSMFCSLFFSDRSKWDFWGGQKCTKMEFSDPMSPCAHGSDKNKEPAETLISEVGVFSVDFREPRQTLYCFSKVKLNDGDDWALNIYDDDTMYPPATRWQRYWIVDKTSLEM